MLENSPSLAQPALRKAQRPWARVAVALLFPLLWSLALALPGYLLGARGMTLSVLIYLGELGGSICLIAWRASPRLAGLAARPRPGDLGWAGLFCIGKLGLLAALIPISSLRLDLQALLYCLFFLLLNAPGEELHFRGLVYGEMGQAGYRLWQIILVSSALFGVLHLTDLPPQWALVIAFDGMVWAAMRARGGTIYPAILAHGVVNAALGGIVQTPDVVADGAILAYMLGSVLLDCLLTALILRRPPREAA